MVTFAVDEVAPVTEPLPTKPLREVDYVEQRGLETWCRSLRPITDQFVRAASRGGLAPDARGTPDRRRHRPADRRARHHRPLPRRTPRTSAPRS
ncbi:hypothetical protein [Actinosynnema sp. ALI-1.44]|uniref:hypothetical protein n=1 Tax=Actinosynnema sp. ALI-1.44 TaxID=1933779 RepID=UPI0011778CFE|nr:hypothetical protein [Actinosynnema sp. ALI-1.44]